MKPALTMVFCAALLFSISLAGGAPALTAPVIGPLPRPSVILAVRDLKTLSQHDRLTLPDATKVLLGNHTVTLGELRRIHTALVASHNYVKSLNLANLKLATGVNHSTTKMYSVSHLGGITVNPSPTPTPRRVIVPIKTGNPYGFATPTPAPATVPFVGAGNSYPVDYQRFCNSVPATVCLFYPAGVTWYGQDGNNLWTIDYLVTDGNVCKQEGGFIGYETGWGQLNGYGCIYEYPLLQTVNFAPPANGFTTQGWCSQNLFSTTVDTPHGAVQIKDNGAENQSVEEFCFLQVHLNH